MFAVIRMMIAVSMNVALSLDIVAPDQNIVERNAKQTASVSTMMNVVQDTYSSVYEPPNEILHDQYTLVLENLFIGLTKSCPKSLNYLPEIFKGPTEALM